MYPIIVCHIGLRFKIIIFFLFVFPPVWLAALYISPTFFCLPPPSLPYPLSLPSLLLESPPPHKNVTAAILSYVVSHLYEGTGKLRKTYADTVGHLRESVLSLPVSENDLPLSVSMRKLRTGGHPSKY